MNTLFEKISIFKMIVIYFIANILNVVVVLQMKHYWAITQDVTDELMRASMFAILLIWFIALILRSQTHLKEEIKKVKNDIRVDEWVAILIFNYALSLSIVLGIMLCVSYHTPPNLDQVAYASKQNQVTSYLAMLINFVASGFIVPIVEEFMFRGVLLNGLMKKYHVGFAVILSSVLFGLTHIALSSLGATIFGICMCAVYLRTKNIFVPIIMHCTHNIILNIIQSKGTLWGVSTASTLDSIELTTAIMTGSTIIFVIIAIISGVYLARQHQFFNFTQYLSNERKDG